MSLPRLRAMLVRFSSRTSPTAPTLWHVGKPVRATRFWGQIVATSPIITTVHSAAATAAVVSTEVVAAGTGTVDWIVVIPAGKITMSPHVVTPTVIQPSRSTPTVGTPIPIIKIATTAATVANSGLVHNGIMPTRTGPEMTARHHHAPCMRVIVSSVIRPSHCFRHTRTVGTSVPRNNAATSVSTNYHRLSVVLRQPAAPSVATMAKATSARKITGE